MKKAVVEFIGTFFLVFAVGMNVIAPGSGNLAPIAIGLTLAVMIYAGGHISGAHYNPAVTVALLLRGKCPVGDVVPYIVAQVLGAGVAALLVGFLKDGSPSAGELATVPALLAEFVFTFALVWVIQNVATAKATEGNSFYGLAIGGTVMVGAFAVGGVSGAVFNPAVAVGISIMGLAKWSAIWIYLVAQFAAAVASVSVFKWINGND